MRYHITDHTGHTTLEFCKTDKADMDRAEAKFNELTGLGFRTAEDKGDGKQDMPPRGEQTFNPDAEDVTFIRPIQGG